MDGCGKVATFVRIMLPDAKPIITSCFLFAYVWQWTDSFYSNMFLSQEFVLLSTKLSNIAGALDSYLDVRGIAKKATTAYSPGDDRNGYAYGDHSADHFVSVRPERLCGKFKPVGY